MKNVVCGVCLLVAVSTCLGQNSTLQDLLRAIQPGGTAPAQPPASPTPQPSSTPANPPVSALDTKPVFMSVVTNYVRVTNQVIVTNYVVVTNLTFATNYYNAQGQLLTLISPAANFGAAALPDSRANSASVPDAGLVRSNQLQAVRDLLTLSLTGASNIVCAEGSFMRNANIQIKVPEGVTGFDRKKNQNLVTAMNTAAQNAAPSACALIQKIVAQLSPKVPAEILQGSGDSAARYLVANEGQNISNQILDIVHGTAQEAHLSEAYNAVMLRGGGLLGAVLGTTPSVDIDPHVARGLLEAIVLNLSSEENRIRSDPNARKTKVLQDALPK